MDELPIGRRVAYWRSRRRMSQQAFADRLGKSKSWVDKVERGVRRLDRYSVIDEIADVLAVDTQLLLGRDPHWPGREAGRMADRAEVADLRAALERYDQVDVFLSAPPDPPDLRQLRQGVQHAWLTYQHADAAALTRSLPLLLRMTQAAATAAQADTAGGSTTRAARECAGLLSQVHQIASATLCNLGEHELARLAADRAVAAAQAAGDQLLVGAATVRVGTALLALGRARPALEVHLSVADRLARGDAAPGDDPPRRSVSGLLLLAGALAAARLGHESTVDELLGGAQEAADRVGGDHNHYWTSFGPTNVALHRAAAAVELGDGWGALAVHARLRGPAMAALVPERRVQHLLDVARGCVQVGEVSRAVEMLSEARRLAPGEMRCRPAARELVDDVLRRYQGTPPPELREITAGVPSPP